MELKDSSKTYQLLSSVADNDDHTYISLVDESLSKGKGIENIADDHEYMPMSKQTSTKPNMNSDLGGSHSCFVFDEMDEKARRESDINVVCATNDFEFPGNIKVESKTERTREENAHSYNTPRGKPLSQPGKCGNAENDFKHRECSYATTCKNKDQSGHASRETGSTTMENSQHVVIRTDNDPPSKQRNPSEQSEIKNLTVTYKSVGIEAYMHTGDCAYTDCSSNVINSLTGQTEQGEVIFDEHGYIPMTNQAPKDSNGGIFSVTDHAYLMLIGEPSNPTDERTQEESGIGSELPGISKQILTTKTGSLDYAYAYRTTADTLLVQNSGSFNPENGGQEINNTLCVSRSDSSAENDRISYEYITSDDRQSGLPGQDAEKESEESDHYDYIPIDRTSHYDYIPIDRTSHYDYIPIDKTPSGQAKTIVQVETDSTNNECTKNDLLSLEQVKENARTISVSKSSDHANQSQHGITKCKIRKMHAIVLLVVFVVILGVGIGMKYLLAEPNVSILPAFYSVTRGQSITIECSVSSYLAVTSVSWKRTNSKITTITTTDSNKYRGGNVTTPSLTVVNAESDDVGQYICFASNSVGSGTSNAGTLVITEIEPNVSISPAFYSVFRGQSVTIKCSVTSYLVVTSVLWQRKDGLYNSTTLKTNSKKYTGSTVTTPSLTIVNADPDDAGNYTCLATNTVGTGASNPGYVFLKEVEPNVSISLDFYSVIRGPSVNIECSVSSYIVVTSVLWQRMIGLDNFTTLKTNSKKKGSTVTTPSLAIVNADPDDAGNHTCIATNSVGPNASSPGYVFVKEGKPKPVVTISQSIYAVSISKSITLQCSVSSYAEVTSWSWKKNINGSTTAITSTTNPNEDRGSTVTIPSLHIINAEEGDAGNYTCFATNSGGTGSSITALLIVIDVTTMDFKFNRSSVHKYQYINEDNTLISNVKTPDTVPSQGVGFKNYNGVNADKCCAKDQEMSFGILYKYDIMKKLENGWLIFEVGLSERNKIDNYFYAGSEEVGGWSFNLYNNNNYDDVSFGVRHLPLINKEILKHFSANTPGTTKADVFHFNIIINRKTNTFSVVSNQTILYRFANVMSDKDLCPVFGVYSYVNVSLRLIYSTIFTY